MKRVLLLFMIILTMSCSTDDVQERSSTESYSLVFATQELPDFVTVSAGSEVTYQNNFEFINSDYDEVDNAIVINTQPGPVKIVTNFYIENGSEVSITLYDSGGNIVDEQTISQVDYTYIYQF